MISTANKQALGNLGKLIEAFKAQAVAPEADEATEDAAPAEEGEGEEE